eukprot:TRINITY_DN1055_c0_g1_i4.p1 TRINITY_DN1055_c0_g1~~TRINITY_DN1055_c0_g1_i4.p1  ORF type:complete len:356 (+),score=51.39 TRINITY_DN1055_c0_g1_i4:192-1259(+)
MPSPITPDMGDADKNRIFKEWLENFEGGRWDMVEISEERSEFGTGAFATQDCPPSTPLFSIPRAAIISRQTVWDSETTQAALQAANSGNHASNGATCTVNDFSSLSLLYLFLMDARHQPAHPWHVYGRLLPPPQQLDVMLHLERADGARTSEGRDRDKDTSDSDSACDMLQGTQLRMRLDGVLSVLRDMWQQLWTRALQHQPQRFPSAEYNWSWFLWAYIVSKSRMFTYAMVGLEDVTPDDDDTSLAAHTAQDNQETGPAQGGRRPDTEFKGVMVPGLDFLNHRYAAPVSWLHDQQSVYFTSGQDIPKGAEVFNNCTCSHSSISLYLYLSSHTDTYTLTQPYMIYLLIYCLSVHK